jgi:hypothetical protein
MRPATPRASGGPLGSDPASDQHARELPATPHRPRRSPNRSVLTTRPQGGPVAIRTTHDIPTQDWQATNREPGYRGHAYDLESAPRCYSNTDRQQYHLINAARRHYNAVVNLKCTILSSIDARIHGGTARPEQTTESAPWLPRPQVLAARRRLRPPGRGLHLIHHFLAPPPRSISPVARGPVDRTRRPAGRIRSTSRMTLSSPPRASGSVHAAGGAGSGAMNDPMIHRIGRKSPIQNSHSHRACNAQQLLADG